MTAEDTQFIENLFRSLEREMDTRFHPMETRMNDRFDGVEARLDRWTCAFQDWITR